MAIDPGPVNSAYCIMSCDTFKPYDFAKVGNDVLRRRILSGTTFVPVIIERVQSYGMPVGREVFQTCEWIGRFTEDATLSKHPVSYIDRIEEKQYICHDTRANDSNIRRALIDRFAKHDMKNGKGTKANPDFFYGFHADVWAAFSVGFSYIMKQKYRRETFNESLYRQEPR